MEPFGTIWDHLGPLGTTWDHLGPLGTGPMGPYGSRPGPGPRKLQGPGPGPGPQLPGPGSRPGPIGPHGPRPKWSQVAPSVPKWFQMVPNGSKWSQIVKFSNNPPELPPGTVQDRTDIDGSAEKQRSPSSGQRGGAHAYQTFLNPHLFLTQSTWKKLIALPPFLCNG